MLIVRDIVLPAASPLVPKKALLTTKVSVVPDVLEVIEVEQVGLFPFISPEAVQEVTVSIMELGLA